MEGSVRRRGFDPGHHAAEPPARADVVNELDCGFRVDAVRYPIGFHPPGGIDARTFRNQISR